MNFTLHLTDRCNFRCTYCRHRESERDISLEKVKALIGISAKYGNKTGFCFYGGEPLMVYPLIKEIIEYCKKYSKENDHVFEYKMNSNGSLFTEEKIQYLTENKVEICLSHDGLMQHLTKPDKFGNNTFGRANESARLLLKYQPFSAVQTVFSPESCHLYAESVRFLYQLGFRRILAVYASGCIWTDKHLEILKEQYEKIGEFYKECFCNNGKFFLSYIDDKIRNGILGEKKSPCHMGKGQLSVNVEGKMYPCSQFVDRGEYLLGDCESGIMSERIEGVLRLETEPRICADCELKLRCRNSCGCLNLSETGTLDNVSPFQCEHERLVIDLADNIAEELFEKEPEKFKRIYIENHH